MHVLRRKLRQRKELWVELGRQQLTLAGGGGAVAVDPQRMRLTAAVGGSDAAAVSQQGLEVSTLLALKLAACLSAEYHSTELSGPLRYKYEYQTVLYLRVNTNAEIS